MERRPLARALRLPAALLALFAAFLLSASCANRLGWGVVLWSSPEGPLSAGTVVPVYIKSNIEGLYVVGVPDSVKKVELPLWKIELFPTKGKAEALVRELGSDASMYMVAARDGVPIYDKPSNGGGANRVFRLREGQSVKILRKVQGDAVTTGGVKLSGDWYLVLTDDGSRGYVFSYALHIYDELKEGPPLLASAEKAISGRVDLVFSRSWRPEYFQEMLDDDRVDLDLFSLRYGLFCDAVHRQIRLELPAISKVFTYNAITEENGIYSFEGSPLRIKIEGDKRMTAAWTEGAFAAEPSFSGLAAPSPQLENPEPSRTVAPAAAPPVAATAAPPVAGTAAPPVAATAVPPVAATAVPPVAATAASPVAATAAPPVAATAASPAASEPAVAATVAAVPTVPPAEGDSSLPSPNAADQAATPPARDASGPAETGRGGSVVLIVLTADVRESIRMEELRRQRLLEAFVDANGGEWASPGAGKLIVSRSHRFAWTECAALPPSFLPDDAGELGDIAFRLYLDPTVAAAWEGAFSIRFDPPAAADGGAPKRPAWIDFLYRRSPEGLVLALASPKRSGLEVATADPRFEPLVLARPAEVQ